MKNYLERIPAEVRKMYGMKLNDGDRLLISQPSFIVIDEDDIEVDRYDEGIMITEHDVTLAMKHVTIIMHVNDVDLQVVLH